MSDLNKVLKTAGVLHKKVTADLGNLYCMYESAAKDVNNRFREEHQRNNGNISGLEDFFMLNTVLKKNLGSVRNALNLIKRLKSTEDFDISEEKLEDKELEKILNS